MADDRPAPSTAEAELYDRDFYAWTQDQAEALRSRGLASNAIDWDVVAEEVEDLGKRELRAVESLLVRIIQHLHKLRCGKRFEPREHWKKEIRAFRERVSERLSPTLRSKVEADLERLHVRGAQEAARWMELDEPFFDPIDETIRWSLEELLGERDDPVPLTILQYPTASLNEL